MALMAAEAASSGITSPAAIQNILAAETMADATARLIDARSEVSLPPEDATETQAAEAGGVDIDAIVKSHLNQKG
jgi:ribosome biogenesis SPOUT family RNA methylase Rps3